MIPAEGIAVLEININRNADGRSVIELRFDYPDSVGPTAQDIIDLRLDELEKSEDDPAKYRRLLSEAFSSSSKIERFISDRTKESTAIRVRLRVANEDLRLSRVRWEMLSRFDDPSSWLFTNENYRFSRFIEPRERPILYTGVSGSSRILACIANPVQLSDGTFSDDLSGIDVVAERRTIEEALAPIVPDILATNPQAGEKVTLARIAAALREGYDVLYLVCHGRLTAARPGTAPEPRLWLDAEDEEHSPIVPGAQFVRSVLDIDGVPRLVVLASCQSAAVHSPRSGQGNGLASVAAMLAAGGVPAVVAMQGSISVASVGRFMPVFFRQLQVSGRIDQAMASARGVLREEPDAWMPTLYMAMKEGQLWSPPGATGSGLPEFKKWPELIAGIRKKDMQCVPVLGPDLFETTVARQQEIARAWAQKEGLPLTRNGRDDMPHVAQFIATMHKELELRRRWAQSIAGELIKRLDTAESRRIISSSAQLTQLIRAAARDSRNRQSPYEILAKLPFSTYITTNPDPLLVDALTKEGRRPVVDFFRWRTSLEGIDSPLEEYPEFAPSREEPVVFHLLGMLEHSKSIVLTEDDYLQFLTRINSPEARLPAFIARSLSTNPLLLLGFNTQDWQFRVLFRSITPEEEKPRGLPPRIGSSIAVHLTPDSEHFTKPDLVKSYLERYFDLAKVDLSWGSTEQFLADLWKHWSASQEGKHV